MTHHKRRAYPPKPDSNPVLAAIDAARERIIHQMENPRPVIWWMSPRQYKQYLELIKPNTPDPSFRTIGQDTDA